MSIFNDADLTFKKFLHLGTSECDFGGSCRIGSLLDAMQNTANEQSNRLHIWHNDLNDMNISWVLYKTDFVIDKYPHIGDTIMITTYMKGLRYLYSPRYFLIYDGAGEIIGRAGSLLMTIDKSTRRAISPAAANIKVPDAISMNPAIKISMRKYNVNGMKKRMEYTAQYTDIDVNGHVNNARYVDWLCNSLGLELFRKNEIGFLSVNYLAEIFPGETVNIELIMNEEQRQFQFFGYSKGKCSFDIYGVLRSREKM